MAKSENISVSLVRSGRTEWEEGNRLQGATDLPLSETGRAAFVATIRPIVGGDNAMRLHAVLCGPDEASRQSADLLAEATEARVRIIDKLAGIKLGLWEGLQESDLLDRYAKAYRQWREDPTSVEPPGGERLLDAEIRLLSAISKSLEKSGGKRVAIVLRPIEYGLARCWFNGEPTSQLWQMLEDGPNTDSHTVSRPGMRTMLETIKSGTDSAS